MGTDNALVGDDQQAAGEATTNEGASSAEAPDDAGTASGGDTTFSEDYVKELRDEAASHRVKARRGDAAEERLRAASIAAASAGILQDPTDLEWSDELSDDDGWPDLEKIADAARALSESKPHLGRPGGDVGQGQRGDEHDAFSLTDFIRSS